MSSRAAPLDRPARLHAADRIACPSCQAPIRRLTTRGVLVATCDAKQAPRAGERYGRACGQAFYASAGPDGVAVVLAISRDELEILTARLALPQLREALELLGILRARSPEAVPAHPCARCQTETKLTDLYGGACRRCAGLKMPASEPT